MVYLLHALLTIGLVTGTQANHGFVNVEPNDQVPFSSAGTWSIRRQALGYSPYDSKMNIKQPGTVGTTPAHPAPNTESVYVTRVSTDRYTERVPNVGGVFPRNVL